MHDLKYKDIIIIDEYKLQVPLKSLFDSKNIDWGILGQLFSCVYKTLYQLVGWLVGPLETNCLKHATYGDWPS